MADAAAWRRAARARLSTERFDIAVVGGGITGAGTARDAAMRGLRVALLERGDFASGTSSRSSRLVHGGVRYLEYGHLRLVFEASRERRILLRIAPHLVRPLAFTWPVYHGARISRLKLAAGLGLYDALSMFRNVARHERLSPEEVLAAEPSLRSDGLEGGARYFDAATDDARLTLANVISAVEAGATALNHAEVRGIVTVGGRASGLDVVDRISGATFTVSARYIVNASGPWTDAVRALEAPVAAPTIAGSKGVHIAVPRGRVGHRDAITMVHPMDGRVLFTLPARRHTIFGTTETAASAGQREVRASREDVAYLLGAANRYFPGAALGESDVVASWAGIRPLARLLTGGDIGSASREHAIERGPGGVLHITGGKLTTYRAMAREIVDTLVGSPNPQNPDTASTPLPGGDLTLDRLRDTASTVVLDAEVRERLTQAHGTRWIAVWDGIDTDARSRERIAPDLPVIVAELSHAVRNEMAMSLGDLLIRRTHLAFEMPDQARSIAPRVAALVAPLLGWDSSGVRAALVDYDREAERVFGRD